MGQVEGRVALVTGGSDGIGRGIAEALLREGAKVAISGRSPEKAAKAIAEMGMGENLVFVQADASSAEHAGKAVDGCTERFGRVDILVNNVGGASSQFGLVHELTDAGWDDGIKLNLYSAFWTTRRALPGMLEQGWGRIINISSVEGKLVTMPTISPYVVAKHALTGLTKAVALEYGERGITCNAICPGAVETDSLRANAVVASEAAGIGVDEFMAKFVKGSATKRLAGVEQVAAVALLLASDEGGAVTGVQWSVDGGTAPF
jgi:3-hydroxybutyrate dehydrogenase/3-oxoacyl-[acyl-carrier protein] reductase